MGKNDTKSSTSTSGTGTTPAQHEIGYMTQAQIDALYAPYRAAAVMPPAGYVPGVSGEFNYFPGSGPAAPVSPTIINTTPTTTPGSNLTQYTDLSKLLGLFHDYKHGRTELTPDEIQGYGNQLVNWSSPIKGRLQDRYKSYVDWYKKQTFADGGIAQYAQGGIAADNFRMISGPGGPREDKVPARINNTVEARLSDGEVVIPADAVKAAGGGDSQRGAAALMRLSDTLRGRKQGALEIEKVKKKK